MEKRSKPTISTIMSLVCGIWFLLTSWCWVYFICLFVSYPVGLIGILLWRKEQKTNKESRWLTGSFYLHVLGLASSLITLFVLAIFN